mmetsp:Transcript_25762/g.60843  ORF Transcript_25762/g.60843 Transcript_25762/m.60843 type:complete len:214 (-) Transcript_25762:322-963(-)
MVGRRVARALSEGGRATKYSWSSLCTRLRASPFTFHVGNHDGPSVRSADNLDRSSLVLISNVPSTLGAPASRLPMIRKTTLAGSVLSAGSMRNSCSQTGMVGSTYAVHKRRSLHSTRMAMDLTAADIPRAASTRTNRSTAGNDGVSTAAALSRARVASPNDTVCSRRASEHRSTSSRSACVCGWSVPRLCSEIRRQRRNNSTASANLPLSAHS